MTDTDKQFRKAMSKGNVVERRRRLIGLLGKYEPQDLIDLTDKTYQSVIRELENMKQEGGEEERQFADNYLLRLDLLI